MYGIEDRNNLITYIDGVFMPLARPAQASDVIVNIAGFEIGRASCRERV